MRCTSQNTDGVSYLAFSLTYSCKLRAEPVPIHSDGKPYTEQEIASRKQDLSRLGVYLQQLQQQQQQGQRFYPRPFLICLKEQFILSLPVTGP